MNRRTFLQGLGLTVASNGVAQLVEGTQQSSERRLTAEKNFRTTAGVTELRPHDGRLRLFINGQPHDGLFCSVQSEYMKNFIDAGFDVFDARDVPHGWIDDGKYDFSQTDRAVEKFLRQKSDALLIIRCGWYPRNFWWVLKHPEEAAVPHVRDKNLKMPSYASLRWRRDSAEALQRFVEHVEQQYGGNVIGYLPDAGEPGEWFERYAYTEDEDRFTRGYQMGDYSEPMQRAYRDFVLRKYGALTEINRAYRLNLHSIEQLFIPDTDRRLTAKIGHLRSLAEEQAVIDFYEVLNRQVYETLVHYAQKVKEACQYKKLLLVFYGYAWLEQPRGGVSQARSGHVHMDEVLSSPDVDIIVAPYHYDFRQMEGVMSSQSAVSSVLRRGKQFVHECDGSTYLKPCWPCPDHNNPANPEQTANLLKRDLSRALMDGTFLWFMDLSGGMYNSTEMVEEMKKVLAIGRRLYGTCGRSNREVAVVLHSRDAFFQRENEPLRAPLIPQFKQHEIELTGLGYDDLLLENLSHLTPEQTAQYKLWIFPTAVHLTENEIRLITEHCCRNGNHVIWMYAPGVVGDNGIDLARVQRLTGFKLGYTLDPGELAVKLSSEPHAYLQSRKSPMVYGTYGELGPDEIRYHSSLRHYPGSDVGFSITPRFYIEETDFVLGRVLDLPGEPCGLGIRQLHGWTSVLSTAPLLPKHVMRNIARSAGCHVYTDFLGQTYHCENYVGFFAHETGTCRIRFRSRCRVRDAFLDKVIAADTDAVEVSVRVNDAVLLHYEPNP